MAAHEKTEPVYMIGVVVSLTQMHAQTIRLYEKLGLVKPQRRNKNRLYSEADVDRLRQIRRFTQDMGVNLAGVEVILRLLDEMEEMRRDIEEQFQAYVDEAERRIASFTANPTVPLRKDEKLLPVPNLKIKSRVRVIDGD